MNEFISEKLYVAACYPIIEKYMTGLFRTGDVIEYFLVNPIIKSSFLGRKKIIGYVEAISKEKVCDTFYIYNIFGIQDVFQVDSVSKSREVGDVDRNINCYLEATKLLNKEAITNYFNQSTNDIVEQLYHVRKYCKDSIKNKKILINKDIK